MTKIKPPQNMRDQIQTFQRTKIKLIPNFKNQKYILSLRGGGGGGSKAAINQTTAKKKKKKKKPHGRFDTHILDKHLS